MKNKKKIIIIICVVVVIAVILLLMGRNARLLAQEAGAAVQTRALSTMTLADTVGVTGTVESTKSENVYSPVATLAVKTVDVEVGDKVKAGDLLCELNTDNLEKDIAQSQAAIDASESTAGQTIESNEMKYENAVNNLNNGLNAGINSANAAINSAQTGLNQALENYNAAHSAFLAAEAALNTEKAKYEAAYANDPNADKTAFNAAQAAYDQAYLQEVTGSSTLYGAQKAYDSAVLAQQAAVNAANQEIEAYKKAVDSSKSSANTDSQEIALEKLQMQLEQSKITSPIDGTVTVVNAVEGGSSSGVLFVIENTDGLQISTTIKEYDVNRVTTGMTANIQSDGTGDDIYEGKLRSVAPAAVTQTSAVSGTTSGASSEVEFDAVVDVTSQNTALKIGMNARVDIVLDQKDNVLAVPYDAVVENAAGEKVVYAAVQGEKGLVTYQEIPVITGMETDFYIEVSGKFLKEGMLIVTNPDAIPSWNNALPSASASASEGE